MLLILIFLIVRKIMFIALGVQDELAIKERPSLLFA